MAARCAELARHCIKISEPTRACRKKLGAQPFFGALGRSFVRARRARPHVLRQPGHAGPHRLSNKLSPNQPSSVGTEATCSVVVAHILACCRMPMVRLVCPCTLGGPSGWPPIHGEGWVDGGEGGVELDDRWTSLWPRKNAWPPAWSISRVPWERVTKSARKHSPPTSSPILSTTPDDRRPPSPTSRDHRPSSRVYTGGQGLT